MKKKNKTFVDARTFQNLTTNRKTNWRLSIEVTNNPMAIDYFRIFRLGLVTSTINQLSTICLKKNNVHPSPTSTSTCQSNQHQ